MRVFIISLFWVIFCFSSCGKKSEEICATCVCGMENHPKWLKDEITRIEGLSKNHRPIMIKKCSAFGDDIVLVIDEVNSCWNDAFMFFDCRGKRYEFGTEDYQKFMDNIDKFIFVWGN
ncbi:MAG: hypothetical protein IJU72_01600 [Bacteroidales bacterium]|nr:hypothetical protein [Bacteroidales bacterium]